MKRRRGRKRYRRRHSLMASNWGPVLALLGTILGIAAVICAIIFIGLPKLLPLVGVNYNAPFSPTPTPVPTIRPTPTPNPMRSFNPLENQNEIVIESGYKWFGDPVKYDGHIYLTAGKLVEGKVVMCDLIEYNAQERSASKLDIKLSNAHFMFPKINDKWLVYLDANIDDGGDLMVCETGNGAYTPKLIKHIYTGQVEPMLDGDTVAWIERTGTRMDKLFVCDLNTLETTVIQMFSSSSYGQSKPSLYNGTLLWADSADAYSGDGDTAASCISFIKLSESTVSSYNVNTYVHNPQRRGAYTAWTDSHYGLDSKLYYAVGDNTPILIDEGIVDFGLSERFIAYSKNQTIWLYMFDEKSTYRITPDREAAQFMGVSDDTIFWMDVTARGERDIVKYIVIPKY